jgi:hypothetical protein
MDNRLYPPRITGAALSYAGCMTAPYEQSNQKKEMGVINAFSKTIKLAAVSSLALLLGACVSNPSDMANTLNTVGQVAGAAQGMRGGMMPGAGMNALAGGAVGGIAGAGGIGGVAAMSGAQGDPRYARAEDALKQINLAAASCKDMQAKKQATLNSLAEIEPLTANLMFKQQHERLRIQNDSLSNIAKSKKCKLPTIASAGAATTAATAATATPKVNYSKLNCKKLVTEYGKLNADITAAESAEKATAQGAQIQGGIAAIAQIGALVGGNGGMGNAQQINQMAQMAGSLASATGAAGAAPGAGSTANGLDLLQQKTELEAAAAKKRCNLES